MRPILLKIKGLNSFIEEQTIDFEKLTDRGLFGIFGPTGSGKSTILDGITLALYGDMARKSTNIINTNCDSLNIHFEFSISGATVKYYSVDREMKRDNKTGSIKTGKCRLIDTTDGDVILADKVTAINNKIKEIIGLSLEDFMRTVVLPQGKFSEFLKLEGKSRREMLERLFNLEKYGDELSIKLNKRISRNRRDRDEIKGELRGYEDVTTDRLKNIQDELNEITQKIELNNKTYQGILEKYNKAKDIYSIKVELDKYNNELIKINEKKDYIDGLEVTLDKGERASKIMPSINSYEKDISDSKELQNIIETTSNLLEELKRKKIEVENDYEIISTQREKNLPELKLDLQKGQDALEQEKLLKEIEIKLKQCYKLKKDLTEELQLNRDKLKQHIELELKLEKEISDKEKISKELRIDPVYKESISRGMKLSQEIKNITKNIEQCKNKIEINKISIAKEQEVLNNNNKIREELKTIVDNAAARLVELQENPTSNERDIILITEDLAKARETNARFKSLNKSLSDLKKESKELSAKLNNISAKRKSIEEELLILKDKKKVYEVVLLSNKIRCELKEGEACPVCGSIHHDLSKVIEEVDEDIQLIENELEEKERLQKKFSDEEIKLKTIMDTNTQKISEINTEIEALGNGYSDEHVSMLEKKLEIIKKDIEEYNKKKDDNEQLIRTNKDKLSSVENIITKSETIISQNNNIIKETSEEQARLEKDYTILNNDITLLKEELGIEDFDDKNREILQAERELNELSEQLTILREEFNKKNREKESLRDAISKTENRLEKGKTVIEEQEKNREEKRNNIEEKIGKDIDIEKYIKEISTKITDIENNYKKISELKDKIIDDYTKSNNKFIQEDTKLKELNNRINNEKIILDNLLQKENFLDIKSVKEAYLPEDKISAIKQEINIYNITLTRLQGAIENLQNKKGDVDISEDEFKDISNEKENIEKILDEYTEEQIKKKQQLDDIKEKMKKLKDIIKKQDSLEHEYGILDNLDKLFKGKKFVEYVAISKLKYISREASKRLRDITNGNYAIEVNDDGKFIIRDYKNGGVERDASTLSGGETFLASLSLALALSAQVQLKGTAPLELFFLDEGFGTLDDELLDVVMTSLEKIHNDKLKIGIISHVESIKNRVPVKLIVTKAESGMNGSKVRIERS